MAKTSFFADKRFVVTLEEGLLLTIGIIFGWFAGKGAPIVVILIPVALFIVFAFEYLYFMRYGRRMTPLKKKR